LGAKGFHVIKSQGFAKAHGAEMKKIPPKRDFPRNILLTLVARQASVQP